MCTSVVATRVFGPAEQALFARLSGDVNPMHIDPVAARRTQAGAPVVHGVYAVLWALDALIGAGRVAGPISALKVKLKKFIYVGSEVAVDVGRETGTALKATLSVDGLTVATLGIGLGMPSAERATSLSAQVVPSVVPAMLHLPDLSGLEGLLPGTVDKPLARLFGHVAALIGAARVEALARLSTLVGMVCPGMHSILSEFSIGFTAPDDDDGLSFRVAGVDERFRRAELAVAGGGIAGTVIALVRQPPVEQRSMAELAALVTQGEFHATTALIVGGSRGLGAITARAIAAGGGRVVITYAMGEADAEAIAAEIGPEACRMLRYDAREDPARQLVGLEWAVDQVYYFATPQIFRQGTGAYVPSRFREFCAIYVDGFHAVCAALRTRGAAELAAFYPSSVAVEDRPMDMTEYAMAKAAGEVLCADMDRFLRGMRIVVSRLPRMLTDQTATVTLVEASDPVDVMLSIIRKMHGRADIGIGA